MVVKYVYFFAEGKAEGNKDMKNLLGGKGANLHEMTALGIPVPPGFTISTEACVFYFKNGTFPPGLKEEVEANVRKLEKITGKVFGSVDNPLLVSVRSGARASMPGMMDTILNLGLNDQAVIGLAKKTGDERFAYDSYRRFIQMFADVVMGIDRGLFEERLRSKKAEAGVREDFELKAKDLKELCDEYKDIVKKVSGNMFPQDPFEQLWMAIESVFKSWNNKRAIEYRKLNRIPDDWGTAVNVQTMVFGNMGFDSATGVAFTRDPSTGEKTVYGEYLTNAQGEDVVAGIRTPKKLKELSREMPEAYKELLEIFDLLEKHYKDMMDIEFTIEKGKVYLLQTRVGKRSARAEVKIAYDMANEGLISREEAILRVDPRRLEQLLHPMIDPKADKVFITKGLPASPGAASGKVIFDSDEAADLSEAGEAVILVRDETSPDDIRGMARSRGILTARGGMTSHAAVVARGIGKPCVVGAEEIEVDYDEGLFRIRNIVVKKGDIITIDGATGDVFLGKVPTIEPELFTEFNDLLKWADEIRWIGVRANADTPQDAQRARRFGAEGIGLCRTEHMFFEGERIYAVQEMIIAKNKEEREKGLSKLLPMQREDFKGIFTAMDGYPVTIRLLDPPLHEFVPKTREQMEDLAKRTNTPIQDIALKSEALREANPMLGHRGCRLGIVYPEITEMQARAIFEAACECTKEGIKAIPEIMIPIVSIKGEFDNQKAIIDRVAKEVMSEKGVEVAYSVGTMIELPRACMTADKIAQSAEFFSFGTNDLTQTTFGFSRDDIGKFLPKYIEMGILKEDPFQVLDQEGVGALVRIGIEKGRSSRSDLKVGICGEHGGEPSSVEFCHRVGMDYVSCSPFRVPIARLAAAQAVVKDRNKRKRLPH
ncbi:MAG TPA: pyruvate, phosphate dikinase [Candidatus Hydrothermia bacterium]|nr:pyruvate, phosphate dikinase [Candidatus Hydrothermia bacterium]MDD5572846.1 pyruvate, phosphate dikinase [Candidatus Hydrothermia bacterium]HOK22816.1 pyruvate, phosphate dikinase [Candidatus Hydrothermia bacterium]HOL23525.1 pyruvate, phosphate dikinase [Candidatus Hydrothermia bacterium]HOP32257.1 pyruvate, phosphate dikinase [Candidatus Hydrothermia bacterium]